MNIVITGASRGIGFETVLELCRSGHNVIAVSRSASGLEKLQSAAAAMNAANRLVVVPADITSEKELISISHRVASLHDHIDALINNAGTMLNKPFENILPGELRHLYEVNVFAPFRLVQSMLPLMGGAGLSHVVNISSMGGFQGSAKFPGLAAYSSSKSALSGLTEVLAEELKEKNVRVNALALGSAQTEMLEQAFPGYRAPLSAKEMAGFIAWFAANGHFYFNGKILPVAISTP